MVRLVVILFACLLTQGVLGQVAPFTKEFSAQRCLFEEIFAQPAVPKAAEDTIQVWLRWKTVSNYAFGKNRGNLLMITDLNALHPHFRELVQMLVAECKAKGIELAVVESFRTRAKQNEYRSMGKKYTRSAGGSSKHQYGLAVDVVPMVDSVAVWDNLALWRKVGLTGEKLGLRWGGRWRHPFDPGHFEWTQGLSSQQLAKGVFPQVAAGQDTSRLSQELRLLAHHWKAWEADQATMARQPAK
jgi:hypothetical protein